MSGNGEDWSALPYFGYGSNLHDEDRARWCAELGLADFVAEELTAAWLPDQAPVFHYHSKARAGGALSLTERPGSLVPGVLFRLSSDGLPALDRKEGCRHGYGDDDPAARYARERVRVLTEDGRARDALTYRVVPPRREPRLIPPSEHYLALVVDSLRRRGLSSEAVEAAARGEERALGPDGLFVYGSLRSGQVAAGKLEELGITRRERAMAPGRLHAVSWYPGLVEATASEESAVVGELVQPVSAGALSRLDEYEDFPGYGLPDALYERRLTRVRLEAGDERRAWVYVYLGAVEESRRLPGDDWRRRGELGDLIEPPTDIDEG